MSPIKTLIICTALSTGLCSVISAQDAKEIVRKADQKLRGETSRAEFTMKIIRPSWQRSLSMKAWSKGQDYSLILVTAPARDEGTAFLKRENELWNWLPNINRTIKLPPSMMSQSWMGSDFNNDDLVKESSIVNDYNHSIDGEQTIRDYNCYRIIMNPKPEAAVVWGKVILYISKEEYLQLRGEFYDENDNLVKVMEASDVKTMDDRSIPTRLEMIPTDEENHKTILIYDDIEYNIDLSDRFFSIQNLKRVE